MKRFLTLLATSALVLSLTLTGCTNVQPPADPETPPEQTAQLPEAEAGATRESVLGPEKRVVMGFYTDQEGPVPSSKETTLKNGKLLNEVAFFWYSFDANGKVIPTGEIDLKIKDQVQKMEPRPMLWCIT